MKTLNPISGLLTVLLTLALTGPAIAQTNQDPVPGATEEIQQHESQGQWSDEYRYLYTWDDVGHWTEWIVENYTEKNWGGWSRVRFLRIYDDDGKLIEEFNQQHWNGTEWEHPPGRAYDIRGGSPHVLYSYDDSGNEIASTHQIWIGSEWQDIGRMSTTFDEAGRETLSLSENREHKLTLTLFTYVDVENRVESTTRMWNGSEWEDKWRNVQISDDSGNLLEEYSETWNGSDWENGPNKRTTYSYDESGNLIEEIHGGDEEWDDRYLLSYDDSGNLVEYLWQEWHGAWVNFIRDRMVLDAFGRRTEKISEIWRGAEWDPYWRVLYSYETSTGIEGETASPADGPDYFRLDQNYPNPFNPDEVGTTISYDLPEAAEVRLTVVDALGRIVESLVNGHQSSGSHAITWDASGLPSGVYFYRVEAGGFVETKSMILAK